MKTSLPFLILFLYHFASAQSKQVFVSSAQKDSLYAKNTVLIIPFESKLYMSQIDKQIAQRNGLNYEGIVEAMQKSLLEVVSYKVAESMRPYRLFNPEIDSITHELHYVYTSVNYLYRPLPEAIQSDPKEKDSSKIRLPKLINKKEKAKPEPGTRIENGQLVSVEDHTEKFMDVELVNKNLLNELQTLYNSKWFIFLNQLDLLYSPESPSLIRIKVHYTIFDSDSKKHYAGAAVEIMPDNVNDIKSIKDDYLFKIAIQIEDQFRKTLTLFSRQ